MQKYKEYLSGFEKSLKKLPNSESVIKKLKHDPFNLEIFEKFIDRVKKYLRDDDRIERLSRPFASGVMPEIWDDDIAYADFKESFSDYLLLIARQKTHQPAVPKAILSKLDCDKPQDGEELLEDFEDYLKVQGWKDDDWPDRF